MVPSGWVRHLGSEITTKITKGSSPKWQGFDYQSEGTLFITSENVRDGFLDVSKPKYLPLEFNQKLKNSQLQQGDILINIVGASIGRSCQYDLSEQQANINQAVCLFRTNELAESDFIQQYLQLPSTINRLLGTQSESARPNLSLSDMRDFLFALPPLPEQRKIAKILSTWDKAIATTEKLIATSQQQKKALMQQLLTGKKRLVDPDTGKVFEGKWERHSLSDLVYVDRKSLGKKTPDNFKFKYISLSNVDFGMISKELEVHEFSTAPSRARRVLQDGDILMSTVRPNLKGFAKVTSCYADCIASTGFAVLTPKKKVSGDYIYQYIFSAHVTGQIDSLVVGSNYPAINSSDVSGLKVYCPAFEEQQKIASVLTAADKEIEFLEAKLAHLKEEKKALMQQLLTGKRRVKVSETEAA
ncbi:restriction endonuclease subunit S [Providencia manganoxydans]|uniref:restriction endonuclease subunit S n=1 Tax=Providencia manganoxydans TaxID=2923283 RepID=UPI0032DA73F0